MIYGVKETAAKFDKLPIVDTQDVITISVFSSLMKIGLKIPNKYQPGWIISILQMQSVNIV